MNKEEVEFHAKLALPHFPSNFFPIRKEILTTTVKYVYLMFIACKLKSQY